MVADSSLDLSTAVFLDTSLVVAATVEAHPSHDAAASFIDELFIGVLLDQGLHHEKVLAR